MSGEVPLDPVIQRWYERIAELTVERRVCEWPDRAAARELSDRAFAEFGRATSGSLHVTEHTTGPGTGEGVRVRILRLPGIEAPPVVVLVHGGGFAFGSIDDESHVAAARARVVATGCAVVDVDYRLAPEHPFPAGLGDVEAVLSWLVASGAELDLDVGRIVLDGISSGAALAVAAVLSPGGRDAAPVGLVLEMPSLDLRENGHWLEQFAHIGGVAPRSAVRSFYLAGSDPEDPRVSPIAADVSGLPPTHIMTAEFDPLREAAEVFATRLRAGRVSVTGSRHFGATHGSATLTGAWRGARLWEAEVAAVIREFVAEPS